MIARGWLNREEVENALHAAAGACGLADDETGATINSGIEAGITVSHLDLRDKDVHPSSGVHQAAGGRDAFESDHTAWLAPDMTHLGTGRANAPSFPLKVIGDEWGPWCHAHAQARNAPVDYVAVTLLIAASALIGHSRWAKASGEWKEPPHLWAALVGPPASGKSPAMKAITSLLGSIERGEDIKATPIIEKYARALVTAQAAQKQFAKDVAKAFKKGDEEPTFPHQAAMPKRPVTPRVTASDVTPEALAELLQDQPCGLLILRDELAGWLGGFDRYNKGSGGGERALWLEATGGGPFKIDRKLSAPVYVPRLALAMLGSIQPDRLAGLITGVDDGLASRFLWCWPEPVKGSDLDAKEVHSAPQLDALRRLFALKMDTSLTGELLPVYVPLSEAGRAELQPFVAQMKNCAADAYGPMAGAYGKAGGHALRLALVLEFLWWGLAPTDAEGPVEISERAMSAAIDLVQNYFIPMARRALAEASIPPDDQKAMVLVRYLQLQELTFFNAPQNGLRSAAF
jgi:Protein of unknown function (DUF3987)